MSNPALICVNCGNRLGRSEGMRHGRDRAWFVHCLTCGELVADQLVLMLDQPDGVPIQIYECRQCGTTRAGRPTWRTRCQVCLDDRSTGPVVAAAGAAQLRSFEQNPELERHVRLAKGLEPSDPIPVRAAVEAWSAVTVAETLERAKRPGWTILATDIHGLPWTGVKAEYHSHGTWAAHDACGAVAKVGPGSVDCPRCGPDPASRTHLARKDEPYLLYLVATTRWQKFGVGDQRRVQAHVRGGAEVLQVLRAPFAYVVLAEKALKRHHRDAIQRRPRRGMIDSFGRGTEVTRRRVAIDLSRALPDAEDVTQWFRQGLCGVPVERSRK